MRISSELASVNDGNEITSPYKFDLDNYPKLFRFKQCFHDLSLVLLRDQQRPALQSTSTTNSPMFVTPEQQFTTPDPAAFSTPKQAKQVLEEHMSLVEDSPQSTESNHSAKLEHPTASFANGFLRATYLSLAKHLT